MVDVKTTTLVVKTHVAEVRLYDLLREAGLSPELGQAVIRRTGTPECSSGEIPLHPSDTIYVEWKSTKPEDPGIIESAAVPATYACSDPQFCVCAQDQNKMARCEHAYTEMM